jgi:hypothetical protein
MPAFDIDAYVGRSRAVDLAAIDWAAVPRHPVPPEALRTMRFMQDIESHAIVYLRSLLATRAIGDPDVATFLACWVYEETFHGLALRRFLEAAGSAVGERPRPRGPRGSWWTGSGRRWGAESSPGPSCTSWPPICSGGRRGGPRPARWTRRCGACPASRRYSSSSP